MESYCKNQLHTSLKISVSLLIRLMLINFAAARCKNYCFWTQSVLLEESSVSSASCECSIVWKYCKNFTVQFSNSRSACTIREQSSFPPFPITNLVFFLRKVCYVCCHGTLLDQLILCQNFVKASIFFNLKQIIVLSTENLHSITENNMLNSTIVWVNT